MRLTGVVPLTLLVIVVVSLSIAAIRGVRRLRDIRRRARWRAFIERFAPYEIVDCLGMGREGIVFEVKRAGQEGEQAEHRALKLIDSRDGRGLDRRLELRERIEAARKARGLESWSCLPAVYALDIIEAPGHAVPYEEMELVRGRTLTEAAGDGALERWTLQERLTAFDELLEGLHALSEEKVNFVHIDPDNVMLTDDRRFRLIDLSGFRLVGLSARRRRRIFRRLARTFLVLLEDQRKEVRRGAFGEAARELIDQLELYRDLPKGSRPPSELELFSIGEFQNRIRAAFDLNAPCPS